MTNLSLGLRSLGLHVQVVSGAPQVQTPTYVGVQRDEISTLPLGTQIDPDLLRVSAIAAAIEAALPADAGLQVTLGGFYEVVDLRVSL